MHETWLALVDVVQEGVRGVLLVASFAFDRTREIQNLAFGSIPCAPLGLRVSWLLLLRGLLSVSEPLWDTRIIVTATVAGLLR